MRDHLGTDGEAGLAWLDDLTRHVHTGDDRVDARHLAVGQRGQAVLVVDARPGDADNSVSLAEIVQRELAYLADNGVTILLRNEGSERWGMLDIKRLQGSGTQPVW